MAGASCGRALAAAGASVQLFDKGRKPGGRLSTRRGEGLTFDHGAQYFTARTPEFAAQVERWAERGVVAPWRGSIVSISRLSSISRVSRVSDAPDSSPVSDALTRWVGAPTMSAVAHAMCEGLAVTAGVRITELHHDGGEHVLLDERGAHHGPFDALVLALPAAQAAALLDPGGGAAANEPTRARGELARFAASVAMSPCLAGMLAFDAPTGLPFDGAFVDDDVLAWIARDSSKPGRDATRETWILHATPSYSARSLEYAPHETLTEMVTALRRVTGRPSLDASLTQLHRWRYARSEDAKDRGEAWSDHARIGLCGDWCAGDRVEGAYVSGQRLAARILGASASTSASASASSAPSSAG
jgi:predicted NAD/FAD-dependent oxidoreductase